MASGPENPNQAIDVMVPITMTHVVLMLALAATMIAAIWWGTLLSRRRKAAEDQVDKDFATAEAHGAVSPPGMVSIDEDTQVSADVPASAPTLAVEPALAAAASPAEPAPSVGDLTQIKGLGPKLAAALAEHGITRVDQIAALTPPTAAELDAKLGPFQGRMARDRWIEQAKLLSAGDRAGYEAVFGKLGG